jgi:hypothetical protein
MNTASTLIILGAGLAGLLGCAHLFLTYNGNKFDPRDPALTEAMMNVSPIISRETTIGRAAKGFHASHSFGVMFFALVYIYLAGWQPQFLAKSYFLLGLGMVVLLAYLALAWCYWFSIPLRGIGLATALYAGGLVAMLWSQRGGT